MIDLNSGQVRKITKLGKIMLSRLGKSIVLLLTMGAMALAGTVPAGTHITVRTDSQNCNGLHGDRRGLSGDG